MFFPFGGKRGIKHIYAYNVYELKSAHKYTNVSACVISALQMAMTYNAQNQKGLSLYAPS